MIDKTEFGPEYIVTVDENYVLLTMGETVYMIDHKMAADLGSQLSLAAHVHKNDV